MREVPIVRVRQKDPRCDCPERAMNRRLRAIADASLIAIEALRQARRRWRDVRKRLGKKATRWRVEAENWERRLAPPLLLLAGWAAVTAGVAELFGAGRVVWPIGAGLLAWGLYGFRTLWITVWLGLAALRKRPREHPEDR
jgi:hypothetical protein